MAVISKNSYPKAIPLHSPEELAVQNSRLSQWNDELAAQSKRLNDQNKELADKAERLRRWTKRLACACGVALLFAAGAVAFSFRPGRVAAPAAADATPAPSAPDAAKEPAVVTPPSISAKIAPLALPTNAVAKPDTSAGSIPKAGFLEALGGLSATHLIQSHLNIGLLADGVESETYTIAEAEKNLQSVTDSMKLVDVQLAKLSKSGLDHEDKDSIRQIQAVTALLHLQAKSLRAYWATGAMDHAVQFQEARKASWTGLSKVLGIEN